MKRGRLAEEQLVVLREHEAGVKRAECKHSEATLQLEG
jgi:hypothetical protein